MFNKFQLFNVMNNFQIETEHFGDKVIVPKNVNELIHEKRLIKDWIFVGSTVLARWTNGLWYLGLIVEVRNDIISWEMILLVGK